MAESHGEPSYLRCALYLAVATEEKRWRLSVDGLAAGSAHLRDLLARHRPFENVHVDLVLEGAESIPRPADMQDLARAIREVPWKVRLSVKYSNGQGPGLEWPGLIDLARSVAVLAQGTQECTVTIAAELQAPGPDQSAREPDAPGPGVANLSLTAPGTTLSMLIGMIVRRPETLSQLKVLMSDRYPDELVEVELPRGLANLKTLGMDNGTMPTAGRGIRQALDAIVLRSDGTDPAHRAPRLPERVMGPGTAVTGCLFWQPAQTRRIRSIVNLGAVDVTAELGWRARLLDLRTAYAANIHCDAVVILERHSLNMPSVTGAVNLIVVKRTIPHGGQALEAMQAMRTKFPQARVLQTECRESYNHTVTKTVFIGDRLPSHLEQLNDMAVAIGIASGDNAEGIKRDIARMLIVFDKSKAHYLIEGKQKAMTEIIRQASGRVVTMAMAGIV